MLIVSNSAGTRDDPGLLQAESVTHHLRAPVLRHKSLKPSYSCVRGVRSYFASLSSPVQPHDLVVIGDRIFTDVVLARRLAPRPWPWFKGQLLGKGGTTEEKTELVDDRREIGPLAIWTTGVWKREATLMRWAEKKLVAAAESWIQGAEGERRGIEARFVKPVTEAKVEPGARSKMWYGLMSTAAGWVGKQLRTVVRRE